MVLTPKAETTGRGRVCSGRKDRKDPRTGAVRQGALLEWPHGDQSRGHGFPPVFCRYLASARSTGKLLRRWVGCCSLQQTVSKQFCPSPYPSSATRYSHSFMKVSLSSGVWLGLDPPEYAVPARERGLGTTWPGRL